MDHVFAAQSTATFRSADKYWTPLLNVAGVDSETRVHAVRYGAS